MSGFNRNTQGRDDPFTYGLNGETIDLGGGDYEPTLDVKAIVVVATGDVVCRPLNASADITITGAPVGFVLPWHCSKIEATGTTADLATIKS